MIKTMYSTFPRIALAPAVHRDPDSTGVRLSSPLPDIDAGTLKLAQAGDRCALGRLIAHYQRAVFAFLSRALGRHHRVEDLAQEVFLRVVCALPEYEVRDAKLSTWIFQIAVRLLQDERRRNARYSSTFIGELASSAPDPERQSAAKEALTYLEQAAALLPKEQRIALVLFEYHGLDHVEIARVTECSRLTVKTRIFRARRFLEKSLARGGALAAEEGS
jgi:RNA polymerase sigma-70 factor, ECF subfamily